VPPIKTQLRTRRAVSKYARRAGYRVSAAPCSPPKETFFGGAWQKLGAVVWMLQHCWLASHLGIGVYGELCSPGLCQRRKPYATDCGPHGSDWIGPCREGIDKLRNHRCQKIFISLSVSLSLFYVLRSAKCQAPSNRLMPTLWKLNTPSLLFLVEIHVRTHEIFVLHAGRS
jgi:hypothetical protein